MRQACGSRLSTVDAVDTKVSGQPDITFIYGTGVIALTWGVRSTVVSKTGNATLCGEIEGLLQKS